MFKKEDIFVVTGASSGIGKQIALDLNKKGAFVVIVARNEEKLKEIKNECKYSENCTIKTKDLQQDFSTFFDFLKDIKESYGKLKGLICCAGMNKVFPTVLLKEDVAKEIFDLNYFSPLFLAKAFLDKRINIGCGASVTFIASIAGVDPDKGQIIYGASKSALINSAKTLSKEYVNAKIRVNCVSPAIVNTPMNDQCMSIIGEQLIANYPMGIGEPSDISNLVSFLVSDEARWITGQNYIIDGGKI